MPDLPAGADVSDPPGQSASRLRQQRGDFATRPGLALLAGWVGGLAGATDGSTLGAGESVLVSAGDAVSVDAESVGLATGLGLALGCGTVDDAVPLGFGVRDLHDGEATGLLDPVPVPRAD